MDPVSVAPTPVAVVSAAPEHPAARASASDGAPRPFEEALKQETAKQGETVETSQPESTPAEAAKPEDGKPAAVAQPEVNKLPEWAAMLENAGLAKAIEAETETAAKGADSKELADPAAALPETAALPTPVPALVASAPVVAPGAAEGSEEALDPAPLLATARPEAAADPRAAKPARKDESDDALPLDLKGGKPDAQAAEIRLPTFGLERAAAEAPAGTHPTSTVDTINAAAFGPRWGAQATRLEGQAPAQAVTARIETPIGDKGWGDAFQQKIVWLVDRQQQSAELHVNPPNLGPVEVMLSFADDGAQIAFSSPHAAVREAIEASLGELRSALSEKGLTMGEALVSADSSQAREQFQAEAQARQGTRANRGSGAGPEVILAPPSARMVQRGLVDLFA